MEQSRKAWLVLRGERAGAAAVVTPRPSVTLCADGVPRFSKVDSGVAKVFRFKHSPKQAPTCFEVKDDFIVQEGPAHLFWLPLLE